MKFDVSKKIVREKIFESIDLADRLHYLEDQLIQKLYLIDRKKYFVSAGYKSLMGFCNQSLNFTKTQSQRIVSNVRRYEPTSNIEMKGEIGEI